MIQERLITYDTAQLAAEKGFNGKCSHQYMDENGKQILMAANVMYGGATFYGAPTQHILQKWLRDEHMVIVYVFVNQAGIYVEIFNPNNSQHNTTFGEDGGYDTWEDALEVGLYEALKLL